MQSQKTSLVKTDYRNRFNRTLWLAERRKDLHLYFASRNLIHGRMPEQPEWSVIPRTSIWTIASLGTPGFDGWYGIAGDHPTDVVPLNYFNGDLRNVLSHFVVKWQRTAERLKQGDDYGDFRIERFEERPRIGELIEDRARRLQKFLEEDAIWDSEIDKPSADDKKP